MTPHQPGADDEIKNAPEQIAIIKSYRNYCDVHLTTGIKKVIRGTLTEAERIFKQHHLPALRATKSVLVNYAYIKDIDSKGRIVFKESFLNNLSPDMRKEAERIKLTKTGWKNYEALKKALAMRSINGNTNLPSEHAGFIQSFFRHITVAAHFFIPPEAVRYIYRERDNDFTS